MILPSLSWGFVSEERLRGEIASSRCMRAMP